MFLSERTCCIVRGGDLGAPGRGKPLPCIVMLYVGEGPRGNNAACSVLCLLSVTFSDSHKQIGPFWCWFPSGRACVCSRTLWVSPRNSPVRLGVSPTAASTPTGVFSQRFEALFPQAGGLGCADCLTPQLFLLVYLHSNVGLPSPPAAASMASCCFAHPAPQSATLLGPPAATLP